MKNKDNAKNDLQEFLNGFKNLFTDLKTKGRRTKQIPNLITLSRLGLSCFIPPLALSGNLVAATIVTALAASTDAVDGLAARKLDAVSDFGRNLDPVCDKLFAGILIAPLLLNSSTLLTVGLITNLVLEAGIASINLRSKARGNAPKTTWLGKIKTTLLSVLLATIYLSFSHPLNFVIIPMIYSLATASQFMTLVDYYRIDAEKEIVKAFHTDDLSSDSAELKDEKSESPEKEKVEEIEEKTVYTKEDYLKLKEDVEILYTEHDDTQMTQNNGFQKTKK